MASYILALPAQIEEAVKKMEKIAVYPGTFDPITLGHMDVIRASSVIFDEVIVGILNNTSKSFKILNHTYHKNFKRM